MREREIKHGYEYHVVDWLREIAYPVIIRELPTARMERQVINLGWDAKSLSRSQKFGLVMGGLTETINFIHRATNPQLPHKPLRRVIFEEWEEFTTTKNNPFVYTRIKPGFSLGLENQFALSQRIQTLVINIEEVIHDPMTPSSRDILQSTWDQLRSHWQTHPIRSRYPSV